jgi:hypothetical protein
MIRPNGCPLDPNAQVGRFLGVRAAKTKRDSWRGVGGWYWAGVRMGGADRRLIFGPMLRLAVHVALQRISLLY